MKWTIPGAVVDEPISPWTEFALVDLRTGRVVLRVTDADDEARCPECGLHHECTEREDDD